MTTVKQSIFLFVDVHDIAIPTMSGLQKCPIVSCVQCMHQYSVGNRLSVCVGELH